MRTEDSQTDYCVFIQANEKQMLGAIVAEYALHHVTLTVIENTPPLAA